MMDGTPDVQAEYDNLMRRRKIADAMIQRAQTQQPITHWTQGLAQLYSAYQGKKISDEVAGKEKELRAREAQGEQAAIEQLKQSMQGREAQVLAPDEFGPPAPAMPAPRDKVRQALIDAQMSQYPKLRQFGAAQQKFVEADEARSDAAKARMDQLEYMKTVANSGRRGIVNPRDWTPESLAEYEKTGDIGSLVRYVPPVRQTTAAPKVVKIGGIEYMQEGNKVRPLTNEEQVVNFERAKMAGKEVGKAAGKDFAAIGDYKDAAASLKTAEDLTRKGIYTGTLAEWKLAGNKALGLVGGDTTKASNTEQFKLHIAETVIPMLKLLGGNDTDEERKYLERMMAGDISLEPATIAAKLKSAQAKLDRKAQRAAAGVGAPATAPKPSGREVLDAADAILRGQ